MHSLLPRRLPAGSVWLLTSGFCAWSSPGGQWTASRACCACRSSKDRWGHGMCSTQHITPCRGKLAAKAGGPPPHSLQQDADTCTDRQAGLMHAL